MVNEPNLFAYIALLLWLPLSILFFALLHADVAAMCVLLGAALFLPSRLVIDLPGAIPDLDRQAIAALAAVVGCLLFRPGRLRHPIRGWSFGLPMAALVGGAVATAMLNAQPILIGPRTLPGLTLYDGLAAAFRNLLELGVPFVLGRSLVRCPDHARRILRVLVYSGIAYSTLILVEVRLSPLFHQLFYGYLQHSFAQTVRWGAFRPIVFMPHPLAVALFVATALLASAVLWRSREHSLQLPALTATVWLAAVMALCKSAAALAYSVTGLAVIAMARPRGQAAIAALLASLILAYPFLRVTGIFPAEPLVRGIESIAPERARSLAVRFRNEEMMFERGLERPWFGWGAFGRSRIHDPSSGASISLTDGYWLIEFGRAGMVGCGGVFLLLLCPVFLCWRSFPRISSRGDRRVIGVLAMVVAVSAADLLPNSFLSPARVFLSGALWGSVTPVLRRRRRSRTSLAGTSDPSVAGRRGNPAVRGPDSSRLSRSETAGVRSV